MLGRFSNSQIDYQKREDIALIFRVAIETHGGKRGVEELKARCLIGSPSNTTHRHPNGSTKSDGEEGVTVF